MEYARRVRLTGDADCPRLTMVRTQEPRKLRRKTDTPGISEWSFLSDVELPDEDAETSQSLASWIARLGRARWKIENRVFKTLKESSGCNMKHNYGHGRQHLWMVLTHLMLIAFQLDQLQLMGSTSFQNSLASSHHRPTYLWKEMYSHLAVVPLRNWEMLFQMIAEPNRWVLRVEPATTDPPDR